MVETSPIMSVIIPEFMLRKVCPPIIEAPAAGMNGYNGHNAGERIMRKAIMTFPIDPNILYVLLIASLWVSVTAVYWPGTGVVEVLALVGVVASVFMLAAVPTNWIAVIAIVIGVMSFLVFPLLDKRYAAVAYGGLVFQAVGSLTLFNGASVSLALIAIVIASSLLYHRFILLPAMETQQSQPAMQDDQPIIGALGHVQMTLNPVGTVYVRGESWTARSDVPIESGTEIIVTEREGLTLFVEPVKRKREELDTLNEVGEHKEGQSYGH